MDAHHAQPLLRGLRGTTACHDPHQALDVPLALLGLLDLALVGVGVNLLPDIGYQVRSGQDRSVGPSRQGGHHNLVVTTDDGNPPFHLLKQGHQKGHIATGVLDPYHVIQIGHALRGPPPVVGACGLGNVVEDEGQAHPGHGLVVLVHLIEGGLEVEGRHHEGGGRSCVPSVLCESHGIPGVRAPCTRDDRYAARHLVDGEVNDAPFLRLRQIHELARRAYRHHSVDVGQHVPDQTPHRTFVDLLFGCERRYERGYDSLQPIRLAGHVHRLLKATTDRSDSCPRHLTYYSPYRRL